MHKEYFINGEEVRSGHFFSVLGSMGTSVDINEIRNGDEVTVRGGHTFVIKDVEVSDLSRYYINRIPTLEKTFFHEILQNKNLTEEDRNKIMEGEFVVSTKDGKEVSYRREFLSLIEKDDVLPPTIHELRTMSSIYDRTYARASAIMLWCNENSFRDEYISPRNIVDLEFGKDFVRVRTGESWAYGGYEEHSYTLPFEWFDNDDWHESYIRGRMELKNELEEKERAKKRIEEKKKEAKEREEYERLREKFGE